MNVFGDCTARHALEGAVVRCELAIGHPPPHAAEVGDRQPRLVTWEDDTDHATASADPRGR